MKERKSKLDQFAETLLEMDDQKQTLPAIQAWLKGEGVTVSSGRLSTFLEGLRRSRLETQLLAGITSGARQVAEVEKQFSKNPAPELESLIKLLRVAILNLSTQAQANPELLKLVDQLTRTVMEFVNGQTKAAHKERELTLAESKFKETLRTKLETGLAELAQHIKGNAAAQKAYEAFKATIAESTK